MFLGNYEQQIPMAWLKEKGTPRVKTTSKAEITSRPIESHHCFNYKENEGTLAEVTAQCETTASCATIFDVRTSEQEKFCDEQNLCAKHNITSGDCAEVCAQMCCLP